MSAGGIRFPLGPLFANADTAKSAIEDAVSNPRRIYIYQSNYMSFLAHELFTEPKQYSDWIHLIFLSVTNFRIQILLAANYLLSMVGSQIERLDLKCAS